MKSKSLLGQIRYEKNISLRELAKETGLSKSTINNIENGVTSPTVEELIVLAKALDCHTYDLYSE